MNSSIPEFAKLFSRPALVYYGVSARGDEDIFVKLPEMSVYIRNQEDGALHEIFSSVTDAQAAGFSIPEVGEDPQSPQSGDTWVLRSMSGGGTVIGIMAGLTYAGSETFQLSYKTIADGIKRVTLA